MEKPDGGQRPILNLPLFAKLWSRMRRPLCEEWESRHKEDCFWGSSTSTCDRASWIHNTLMAFAQGDMNLAAGTGLLDFKKFYEYVSHEKLHEAAM